MEFVSNIRLIRVVKTVGAFRLIGYKSEKRKGSSPQLVSVSTKIDTVLSSTKDVGNIVLLLLLLTLVLSMIGVELFGKFAPEYFGQPVYSMYSIFTCLTSDGWVEIFAIFEASSDWFIYWTALFFFIFVILFLAFIFTKLIVAVLTTNLEEVVNQKKEEEDVQSRYKKDFVESKNKMPERNGRGPVVHLEKVKQLIRKEIKNQQEEHTDGRKGFMQQAQLNTDLSKSNIAMLENYSVLISALRSNMSKRKTIIKNINSIVKKVKTINNARDQSKL